MRVGIVGAGFAGLSAAIAFRNKGHDVTVYEKTAGPSAAGGAISLGRNALTCLSILGVRDQVVIQPWSQVAATVRTRDGRILVKSTLARLTGGDEYATVMRADLITWLAAELPELRVHYSTAVRQLDADGTVDLGDATDRFDLVIAADGLRSVARRSLWADAPAVRSTGISGWAWTVDCELATGFGTIWGHTADFGVLPVTDGRTYVYGGALGHADLKSYQDWPDPLPELIAAATPDRMITPEIFEARPPRQLVRGRVVLIGDAAHPMRPTFGQGAALAMEDAITLAHNGTAGLSRRRRRILALYALSKAGSQFTAPGNAALETARNWGLRLTPDPLFELMAGSVSRWQPEAHTALTA